MEEKKEKKRSEEEYLKLKRENEKKTSVIIILLFTMVLMLLLILLYFFNNKNVESNTDKGNSNSNQDTVVVHKITSVSKITINDTDQVVNVGDKKFIIKNETNVDGSFLLIDNKTQNTDDGGTVYADNAYVTNKFIIFTVIGQEWDDIVYAIDQDGNKLKIEGSNYQIHDLKVVNEHLQASGHIFCGLDEDCPDVDLDIVYEDNKIIVTPKQ